MLPSSWSEIVLAGKYILSPSRKRYLEIFFRNSSGSTGNCARDYLDVRTSEHLASVKCTDSNVCMNNNASTNASHRNANRCAREHCCCGLAQAGARPKSAPKRQMFGKRQKAARAKRHPPCNWLTLPAASAAAAMHRSYFIDPFKEQDIHCTYKSIVHL